MSYHAILVGGSIADRRLNCPGSYQATLALPPAVDKPSEYAEEGTAMHAVMTHLMQARQFKNELDLRMLAQALLGRLFHDRKLTEEHLDTMIFPALDRLMDLEDAYGSAHNFEVLAVEKSVAFPGILGAHGTCDLIMGSDTHTLHIDWKFGSGIAVKAVYEDEAGDIVNPQILFYVCAAMASARHLYKGQKLIVGAIIQPRGDHPLTHTLISRKEVKWFVEDLQKAATTAINRDPPRKKGEWCRFAPCKVNCPLWTKPMLELATLPELKRTEMVTDEVSEYGDYLGRAKTLVDIVAMYKDEVDKQLHAYLEDGGYVPGWRLKAKVKQRQWVDLETVADALEDLGFSERDIWQDKLQTFASTDATAKRLGVEIPSHLRVAPATNETTICRVEDPAPIVTKPLAIEQFRAALGALKKQA